MVKILQEYMQQNMYFLPEDLQEHMLQKLF